MILVSIGAHEIDTSELGVEEFIWRLRFWSHVDRSGGPDACWPWLASVRLPGGHGIVSRRGRQGRSGLVHRFSWEFLNGPIPKGLCVCHKCDNPPCVNPDHLFLGTQRENMQDMWAKGRGNRPPRGTFIPAAKRGEDHYMSKLTEEQVLAIRKRSKTGEPYKAIAADFGVCSGTVSMIKLEKIWKHLWKNGDGNGHAIDIGR